MSITQKDFDLSSAELTKINETINILTQELGEQGEDLIGFDIKFLFTSVGRHIFVSVNDDFIKREVI